MPKKSKGAILEDMLEDVQNMVAHLKENVENDDSSLRMMEERLESVDDDSRKGRELIKEVKK